MTDVLYDVATWVVAVAFLFAIAFAVLWGMHVARDYAADRKREQQFADEWVRVHRARHDHSDDRRPE